eukprot:2215985-Rhodomonas_salina.1
MLGVTASVGPSMIIWVSITILATTNSQCGRMSAQEINNYYHPVCQTRDILHQLVRYKFKVSQRGEMQFKSKGVARGTAAHMA